MSPRKEAGILPEPSPSKPWPKQNYFGRDREGRLTLFVSLETPPSDNKLYWVNQWGGLTLTTAGRNYKRIVCDAVARALITAVGNGRDFRPNIQYEIFVVMYFPKLETSGWTEGSKKSRFLKLDTGNRQKLILDAITEAIGIDDRHIFKEVLEKREGGPARIEVLLREREGSAL